MKIIPLKNEKERYKVLKLLNEGKKYTYIMERYDIGKSSLSEYNKKLKEGKIDLAELEIKFGDNNTEPQEELTEPQEKKSGAKKQKISPDPKEKILVQEEENLIGSPDIETKNLKIFDNLLSQIEFETFKNSVDLIYESSKKRYKSAKATGMLNALNTIKITVETIKKRLGY